MKITDLFDCIEGCAYSEELYYVAITNKARTQIFTYFDNMILNVLECYDHTEVPEDLTAQARHTLDEYIFENHSVIDWS